jgi:hypothetical protein
MANVSAVPMQNPFHHHRTEAFTVLFLGFWGCVAPHSASADSQASQMKLIATGGQLRERYNAGIEIDLKPGALTYWRQPGDAGVPPVFVFDGSINLASARVFYPAPTRIKEDESEAFGYLDKVVFPLHVTASDKTKPVVLKLTVDYAVCERICIPVKARAEITLPEARSEAQTNAITEAEAQVPRQLSAPETANDVALVTVPGTAHLKTHLTWRLIWKGPGAITDLFAEEPVGWYFETKKTPIPNEFSVVAVETPKTLPPEPISLNMTLTGPLQNYELTLPLDPASAAR